MNRLSRRDITVPDLDKMLDALPEGAMHQIARSDYERLFGTNGAALGRMRNFAKHHACVISFADSAILFRKKSGPERRATSGKVLNK